MKNTGHAEVDPELRRSSRLRRPACRVRRPPLRNPQSSTDAGVETGSSRLRPAWETGRARTPVTRRHRAGKSDAPSRRGRRRLRSRPLRADRCPPPPQNAFLRSRADQRCHCRAPPTTPSKLARGARDDDRALRSQCAHPRDGRDLRELELWKGGGRRDTLEAVRPRFVGDCQSRSNGDPTRDRRRRRRPSDESSSPAPAVESVGAAARHRGDRCPIRR